MTRTLCFFLLLTFALGLAAVASADAQTVTTFVNFTGADGASPEGGLVLATDGNFYGTTYFGGSSIPSDPNGYGYGTVFKITPSGTITTLHNFGDGSVTGDGAKPDGVLIQGTDGNFYGTTSDGGTSNKGTVFRMTPLGTITVLHNFGDGSVANDGEYPQAGLILGTDGNFYGTTYWNGSTKDGTVFKMAPSGTVTILHSFSATSSNNAGVQVNSDGANPVADLVQGHDGNLYGTTLSGGSAGGGVVFNITPSGVFTLLHAFGDGTVPNDGLFPGAPLIQGRNGSLYGTTENGGSSGVGAVFQLSTDGTRAGTAVTTLYSFQSNPGYGDGSSPIAALVQGTDGNFYGAKGYDGMTYGTIFKITPAGVLTTLYTYSAINGPNIADTSFISSLVQGRDGNFYGTTENGGIPGNGTVFRFNVSGTPLTITSIGPASGYAGDPAFNITITGTYFTNATTVTFGGTPFGGTPVTVVSQTATQLKVTVPANAIATVGTKNVIVSDPNNDAAEAVFTVTSPWNVKDVAAVSDGTARLLWDRGDGTAGIWIMNAADAQTAVGPTYGPYQGWTAQDITAAADGTSRILWNRYDGATGVWALNQIGVETSIGPTYGPFSGWKAIDLATASNGTSRLMWRYTNGQAGLLSLNAIGGEIISGRSYGPYTGWTATAVGAAGDGTARMLWTRSDGAMGIWTMDANDLQTTVGPTYGPYSDSHGTWRATDLSTSSDGTSEVLWKRSDGAIGVWTFSASNVQTLVGPVYGPYAGFTAAALDAASDKARVLWVRSDRAAGVWSFGSNDLESLIGPIYGPY